MTDDRGAVWWGGRPGADALDGPGPIDSIVHDMSPTVRLMVRPCRFTFMLQPGTPAPAFALANQDSVDVSLADQAGHWLLLWWYPKASTPG